MLKEQMEALAELSREIELEDANADDDDEVCDEDVGFSASVLAAHAGQSFFDFFYSLFLRIQFVFEHECDCCQSDVICRLLPQHGRSKLLQLIKDVYHRFHVLHCGAGDPAPVALELHDLTHLLLFRCVSTRIISCYLR